MNPVILLVAADPDGRRAIHDEMASRYRRDYELMVVPSIDDAVAEGQASSTLSTSFGLADQFPST